MFAKQTRVISAEDFLPQMNKYLQCFVFVFFLIGSANADTIYLSCDGETTINSGTLINEGKIRGFVIELAENSIAISSDWIEYPHNDCKTTSLGYQCVIPYLKHRVYSIVFNRASGQVNERLLDTAEDNIHWEYNGDCEKSLNPKF